MHDCLHRLQMLRRGCRSCLTQALDTDAVAVQLELERVHMQASQCESVRHLRPATKSRQSCCHATHHIRGLQDATP